MPAKGKRNSWSCHLAYPLRRFLRRIRTASAARPAISPRSSSSRAMTATDLIGAEYWATFWDWIADKAFIIVVIALAVEYISVRWAKPHREALDDARKLEIAQLTKDAARLSAEGNQARAAVADANARAAEASQKAAEAQLALEKFKTPRTLTGEQLSAITEATKAFAGTPFDLYIQPDQEPLDLANQVTQALLAAHWNWSPVKESMSLNRPGKPGVGMTTSV